MSDDQVLTPLELDILAIEQEFPKYGGMKDAAILDRTGMRATPYFQVLNALIDRSEAMECSPVLVGRLRRIRERRRQGRAA